MANVGVVAGNVARGGGGLFGKLLKFRLAYIFVIFLFIQAVSIGWQNGGGIEIVRSLGERFLNITQNLQSISLDIINNGAIFESYTSFMLILWGLFSNGYLVYLWIKFFSWLWGLYNDSQKLLSYILGTLTFLTIQVFYLFIFSTPLEGQTNMDLFLTPILAFWDFLRAVILVFSSIGFQKAIDTTNSCLNSSVCVL